MGAEARAIEEWRDDAPHESAAAAPPPAPLPDPNEPLEDVRRWPGQVATALLALASAAWVGIVCWRAGAAFAGGAVQADMVVAGIAILSAPLALIGTLYLLLRRTSRREARRFERTSAALRDEAARLEQVLATLSARIGENRRELGDHAHQLLLIGDDSTARLGEISAAMRAETDALARQSNRLEQATRAAKADIGLLMADLPRATAESRNMAALLRDAGLDAREQTAALESTLARIAQGSRTAEQASGEAAQRLAAQLAQIETASDFARETMSRTTTQMGESTSGALAEAAGAVDEARRAMDTQSAAMLAMIAQGRVILEQAGAESAHALSDRLDAIGARLDRLGAQLTAHEKTGGSLLDQMDAGLRDLTQRFDALGDTGARRTAMLGDALTGLRAQSAALEGTLDRGGEAADALLARAEALAGRLRDSGATLHDSLPATFEQLDARLARSRAAIAAAAPLAAALAGHADQAATRLGDAEALLRRQADTIAAIGTAAEERLATIRDHADRLEATLAGGGEQARQLVESAGPQLIESLLRVRETAIQAAEHARAAFADVIPAAAATLGQAAEAALGNAIDERIAGKMAEVAASSDQAVQATQRATERLMRQMLTIADTTAVIETRIAEARAQQEATDEDNFGRRVASLIDALNSTAIDVTGLLSQEVADGAWAAYLKGDRGIFTRRAVRLLDGGEVREIQRLYESDAGFREQLNRYVHDFEAMLRHVLASREGSPLGITLLSSDMGKLYVALAQAIERLRA